MSAVAPRLDRRLAALERQREHLRTIVRGMTVDELAEALFRDVATGLLNKRAFHRGMSQVIALIDLDSLKWVNDTHGHEAGDRELRQLAALLMETFGPARVYRLGGDEFAVRGDSAAEIQVGLGLVRQRYRRFSFGLGRTVGDADVALIAEKLRRQRLGERAARGEPPP